MAKAKSKRITIDDAIVPVEEQLYEVPENWCWTRIEAIADFERGITFPASAKENEKTEENIPCLRTANIQDELDIDDLLYVDKSYMKSNQNKLVRKDDIIMSSANSRELVGKVSYVHGVTEPMTFGGFVLTIRAKGINPLYLFYYLRYEFLCGNFMGESTQTTNIANINTSTLGKYKIPLPPLPEQQRIVEQIESLFAKLDEAKEKAQEALDGFRKRRAAIFHSAVAGKLTEQWRRKNNSSLEEWKKMQIGEIGDIVTGSTPSTKEKLYYGGNIPFIKPTELNQGKNVISSVETLTEAGKSVSRPVRKGSTCVCCIGATISKCGYLQVDAVTNQQINTIMPYDFMDDKYVYYYCSSNDFKDVLIENSSATTLPIINKGRMSELPIMVPPKDEQTEIALLLDELLEKEERVADILEQIIDDIALQKKSILAKAFRGELGTNVIKEDSSLEIIKRMIEK